MKISCAFAPGPRTVEDIVLAEQLGYYRAWLYDSPTLYLDLWSTLVLAASRTTTIGLASGVAVPALRNVTVTASALLTAHRHAPGRIVFGLGAGGTGMLMVGRKPLAWKDVIAYADAVRALLRGEEIEWEGAVVCLVPALESSPLPVEIPVVFAAEGPTGEQAAHDHADGIYTVFRFAATAFDWSCRLIHGTVLDAGEPPTSDRAFAAASPGIAPSYHFAYVTGNFDALDALPGGSAWRKHADAIPREVRNRAVWQGNLLRLSELDKRYIPREMVAAMTCTGTPGQVRERLESLAAKDVTEIVYQPAGPDIARELREFAKAAAAL